MLVGCGGGGGNSKDQKQNKELIPWTELNPAVTIKPEEEDIPDVKTVDECLAEYGPDFLDRQSGYYIFCDLLDMPFIGTITKGKAPTLSQIMERVSGTDEDKSRFEYLLGYMPESAYFLFNSIRIISIRDFGNKEYSDKNHDGLLQLNSNNLWYIEPEECRLHRHCAYSNNYSSIVETVVWTAGGDNSPQNLGWEYRTIKILFHDLAYANDIFPIETILNFKGEHVNYLYEQNESEGKTVADALYSQYPLSYSYYLTQVVTNFGSGGLKTISEAFDDGEAVSLLSYKNRREDVAELFSDSMMRIYFVFIKHSFLHNEYQDIAWGINSETGNVCIKVRGIYWAFQERNKESHILNRSRFVVEKILPDLVYDFWYEVEGKSESDVDCRMFFWS